MQLVVHNVKGCTKHPLPPQWAGTWRDREEGAWKKLGARLRSGSSTWLCLPDLPALGRSLGQWDWGQRRVKSAGPVSCSKEASGCLLHWTVYHPTVEAWGSRGPVYRVGCTRCSPAGTWDPGRGTGAWAWVMPLQLPQSSRTHSWHRNLWTASACWAAYLAVSLPLFLVEFKPLNVGVQPGFLK